MITSIARCAGRQASRTAARSGEVSHVYCLLEWELSSGIGPDAVRDERYSDCFGHHV